MKKSHKGVTVEEVKNKQRKAGLPPGTILYTGKEESTYDVKLDIYSFDDKGVEKKVLNSSDDISFIKTNNKFNWINITGVHNVEIIEKVGELFNIDSLILEDLANVNQMVKIEDRGSYLFIVLKTIEMIEKKIIYDQVSFILIGKVLITFQENCKDIFASIKKRLETPNSKIVKRGVGYLSYAIIDNLFDNYFEIIDSINDKIGSMEYNILKNFKEGYLEEILYLKKQTLGLKKITYSMREINLKFFSEEVLNYFGKDLKNYFRDLYDHVTSICSSVDSLTSDSSELLQIYYTTVNNNMNSVMKILTIISTIFIPLGFLTGLYGMNFKHMPELENPNGYFYTLGVMLLIIIIMIIYFKKKKWW